ncbi:hypothetical protein SAMN05443247_06013 [Bradyrhizobium erythrophlei]|nr:hypothetical protein SAMN05443247_06013 [Bradyrhizobium erythrophlei]
MNTISIALPPYTRVHTSEATGVDYLRWEASSKDRKAGFKPACVALGTDVPKAIARVKNDLLPRLRAFQSGSTALHLSLASVPGTVDELLHIYMTEPTSTFLTNCSEKTQKMVKSLLKQGANHVLRSGPHEGLRFGSLTIEQADAAEARRLRLEFQVVRTPKTDPEIGEAYFDCRVRPRRAELMFEALKAAFNATRGIYKLTPSENPFAGQKFATRMKKETYAADFDDLIQTLVVANVKKRRNIGTMCLTAYDLKIRVESIGSRLMVEHYKPADRPFQMLITHWKTKRATWIDLHDEDGKPLYEALEARLDECKGDRTTGILIPKDGTLDEPWGRPDGTMATGFYPELREILDEAGLPEVCTFTSFRHGGITESAEAGCTENEMMILSGHLFAGTVQKYAKRTRTGREKAQKKVIALREEKIVRMVDKMRREAARTPLSILVDTGK